ILARLSAHTHIPAGIEVVAATGDATNVYTGKIILNTTDLMLHRWTGSVWEAFLALGGTTSATRHEARYEQTTNQNLTNNTDTKLQFQTAITTSNDVTASLTGNQNFTLNRAGLWRIGACMSFVAAVGAGDRYLSIQTGSTINHVNRFTQNAIPDVGARLATCYCSADVRVAASTVICAIGWQNSGGTINTDTFFGKSNHIHLTWLRP
ncbi:MAG: hypothetical protein ACREX8_11775, partial [Gammaproteobacteria bacterium]